MWEKCINFLLISQCILLNKTKFKQLWYLLKKIMCTSSQVRHHQKKAIRQPPTTFLRKAIPWWICYISGSDFLLAIVQVLICQHIKNRFFFLGMIYLNQIHTGLVPKVICQSIYLQWEMLTATMTMHSCHQDQCFYFNKAEGHIAQEKKKKMAGMEISGKSNG